MRTILARQCHATGKNSVSAVGYARIHELIEHKTTPPEKPHVDHAADGSDKRHVARIVLAAGVDLKSINAKSIQKPTIDKQYITHNRWSTTRRTLVYRQDFYQLHTRMHAQVKRTRFRYDIVMSKGF